MSSDGLEKDPAGLMSLAGRVAIITGAGQGIGRAFAKAFAAAGAVAVLAELNEQKAHAVESEIEAMGGRALAIGTDVSQPESVEQMAAAVKRAVRPHRHPCQQCRHLLDNKDAAL